MFGRFANYRLRMQSVRQKYFTLMRKNVSLHRMKVMKEMRGKLYKGIVYTLVGGTCYYYGNQMYSEYHQIKQMKKKLMKNYPSQTYIISFEENPAETLSEVEIMSNDEKNEVKKLSNDHCIYLEKETPDTLNLKAKLGSTIVITAPRNLDQLCNIIQKCHKYRHRVLVGSYPFPKQDNIGQQTVISFLEALPQPIKKDKYIIVDISKLHEHKIDEINNTLTIDVGFSCHQANQILQNQGYKKIFPEYLQQESIHEVIVNNLPLAQSKNLMELLLTMSLVSADGNRFKSSTEVDNFGQIPNLTSLFVGTGGAYAIPAQVTLKMEKSHPEHKSKLHQTYQMKSNDPSELVLNLRRVKNYLNQNRIEHEIQIKQDNTLILKTSSQINDKIICQSLQTTEGEKSEGQNPFEHIVCINNSILENILLKGSQNGLKMPDQNSLRIEKNLLYIPKSPDQNQSSKTFITYISSLGGVLVWSKDKDFQSSIKPSLDATEAGGELMKKIVEVREGIDKRHIFESHQRYERYFAKGFFRKMTEFFW